VIDTHTPEHLVLDEQQIPRVEEAIDLKEWIGHLRMAEVKGTMSDEEIGFGSGNHAEPPRANWRPIREMTLCGQGSPGLSVRPGPTSSVDSADEIA
jgi:hypothetical protein